ncbi:hypothetical protein JKF63_02383 [Porcisia hertigi]|uniref:non-specific serine/threonine protein kinase n=1 Tax=Porcisia hertigi TaxID=2761500 RepID=A0A836L663_9TRYP|nr:hypothetical protein JKF63_02383 [Porcisia hertigi]
MEKYQRVKVLGKGSFGSAILIKRKSDGLLFVVKEVGMSNMSRKEREEARHECTVLQQLQHPNIVRYVEQFENSNNLYIVMEYCDGGDLAAKVKQSRGPMKESNVLYYFSQICLAMEYLHSRHILHRDIKTMNVFLMKNGAVKLGDFGISTVLRTTMGMANTVCGTPYYFSPELCRNRPYNNKSDIWALGVLLYECATGGRHPFDGTSMNQLMQRIVQGRYAPLSSQYSSDFRKMIDWCLQKDPHKRPSIKQTLSLPLMRRSLEQLEENLMLATQCRVRLKDIIDFESSLDQEERRGSSPQSSPTPSPRVGATAGVSPGQAAALAVARHHASPISKQPSAPLPSPMVSPRGGAAPPVVGPKPTGAAQRSPYASPKQDNAIHRFYSPDQKKPTDIPLQPGGGAKPAPTEAPSRPMPPPLAQRPLEEQRHSPSQPSNINLGGAGDRRNNAAGASPRVAGISGSPPNAADAFQADMRRVNAIIARYGHDADERAREAILDYKRRKHEAYLKRQKEDIETRERRNQMRHDELRRVLENQRAAISPSRNNERHGGPHLNNSPSGGVDNGSPRKGTPQLCAISENVQPPSRSPASSPPHGRDVISPRTPASAAVPVFGRDPRRGALPGEPLSRPVTSQGRRLSQQPLTPAAAAPSRNRASATPRKVVYAANSPQQAFPLPRHPAEAPEERCAVTPNQRHSPSSPLGAPRGVAVKIDGRSLAKPKFEAPPRGRKAPQSAGLDGCIVVNPVMLQPTQQQRSKPRRQSDEEPCVVSPSKRRESRALDDAVVARRPSVLSPISDDAHDRRSPRQAAAAAAAAAALLLNRRELFHKGKVGAPLPKPASSNAAGAPLFQRPSRAPQRYLKPLSGHGEDAVSPVASPTLPQSPSPTAASAELGCRGSQGVAPRARSNALVNAGKGSSPSPAPTGVPDIPASAAAFPTTLATPPPGAEEPDNALRHRKMQAGAPAPLLTSAAAAVKDLPAVRMISPGLEHGVRRNQHLHKSEEAALYGRMIREQVSRDDERFLAGVHRGQHNPDGFAVPNTLEALRSLRIQQDKAKEAGGSAKEEANPGSQLALLKQRQRMQQRPQPVSTSLSTSPTLEPPPVARAAEAARSPRSEASCGHGKKAHVPREQVTARPSVAHVTALSLGDICRSAAPSLATPPSPKPSANGGVSIQNSMDGYAEMLQHLKDLLQRRRVHRAGGGSFPTTPTTPTTTTTALPVVNPQGGLETKSPTPPKKDKVPPPLSAVPLSDGDVSGAGSSGGDDAISSPPYLKATKPLHSYPTLPPAVNHRSGGGAEEEEEEDEDDDFEDAVPLSPVRCAELNDIYARQHQPQARVASDDVYTNDVDLTSATMEEELEGEEGYTGCYNVSPSRGLLKGIEF